VLLRGFRRARGGLVLLRLDDDERVVMAQLLERLIGLLEPPAEDPDADPLSVLVGIDDEAMPPQDPGLSRLLPDAYTDDPAAADDFRRFTERSLREGKVASARTAAATLEQSGEIVLDPDQAQAWLLALNDLRLDLGTRLGVTEDPADLTAGLAEDGPAAAFFGLYDWLTWLQDGLIRAVMPR
jgi:hypothetical protein